MRARAASPRAGVSSAIVSRNSASPVNDDLAIISKKDEFELVQLNTDNPRVLKSDVHDISQGDAPELAPGGNKYFIYRHPELTIYDIADSSRRIFTFSSSVSGKINWTNTDKYLTARFYNPAVTANYIYLIDLNKSKNRLLYTESQRNILALDYNPLSNELFFYGKTKHTSERYFLYMLNMKTMQMDSVETGPDIEQISVSGDGLKILLLKNSGGNNTQITILDLKTKNTLSTAQTDRRLSNASWSGNDKAILFSGASGYAVYETTQTRFLFSAIAADSGCAIQSIVWGTQEEQILCLRRSPAIRFSILNSTSVSENSFSHIPDSMASYPTWSADGKAIVYMTAGKVFIYYPGQNIRKKVEVPFSFRPLIRWGKDSSHLLFLDKSTLPVLKELNIQNGQISEFNVPQKKRISDFGLIPGSSLLTFVFPELQSMYIYQPQGSALVRTAGITADILHLKWATNPDMIESVGSYALIQGRTTLGIFFKDCNTINWLQHLDVQKAARFSWSSDGKSVFYTAKDAPANREIYREQIIFIKKQN